MVQQHAQRPPEHEGEGRRGRLVLRLRDDKGHAVKVRTVALVMEHKPAAAAQYRFDSDDKDEISAELAPGGYSIQVFAVKHDVARHFARIEPGKTTQIDVVLAARKGDFPKPTPAQRLAVYGLDAEKVSLQDLTVKRGQYFELDARKLSDDRSFTRLHAKSIKDIKAWLGAPDSAFGHDQPIFGPLPALDRLSPEALKEPQRLDPEVRTTLAATAREFIHGNSRTVSQYEGMINDQFVTRFPAGLLVSIFHYLTVTIDAGATLEIGGSTSVFYANRLRIHQTGTLSVVGTVKADIGTYEEFV